MRTVDMSVIRYSDSWCERCRKINRNYDLDLLLIGKKRRRVDLYLSGFGAGSRRLGRRDAGAIGPAFAVITRVGIFRSLIRLIRCR